jgi:hypothetical protein
VHLEVKLPRCAADGQLIQHPIRGVEETM